MKNIGKWIVALIAIYFIASTLYKMIYSGVTTYQLKNGGVQVRGVIIDEKNYLGNSPVSRTFSYSYQFLVDGKVYKNDSHDPNLAIGDSIDIVYVKKSPNLNKASKLIND